jgi:dolichyl-phosphate-mannose--protein O-mannosyl transferase
MHCLHSDWLPQRTDQLAVHDGGAVWMMMMMSLWCVVCVVDEERIRELLLRMFGLFFQRLRLAVLMQYVHSASDAVICCVA